MVKHYSKRASKKRAYKKRRTVKKSKNATRRKIQNGGDPEQFQMAAIVTMIVMFIVTLIAGPKLKKFFEIIALLAGATQRGGGVQTGGWNFGDLQAMGSSALGSVKNIGSSAFGSVKDMGSSALGSVSGKINQMSGTSPPDAANDSATQSPGAVQKALIANLTELKSDLLKENNPENTDALNCLSRIISRWSDKNKPLVSKPLSQLPSPPESESPIETIKNSIMAEYDNLKNAKLSMVEKIKQGSIIALRSIKTQFVESIDNKTRKLLDYIKFKYSLDDADIGCFLLLKDKFVKKLINDLTGDPTEKINAAIAQAKQDPRFSLFFGAAAKGKAALEAASAAAKNMFGNFFGSGNTPNLQATGTAMTLQSRNNAETDAETKRIAASNAATDAKNKRAAADAATKKVTDMNATAAAGGWSSDPNSPENQAFKQLKNQATKLRNAAKAAEEDVKIKETEAKAAEAVVDEAKAAAAAVTQTTPPSGGFLDNLNLNNLKARGARFLEKGKTTGASVLEQSKTLVKKVTRLVPIFGTNKLTEENFKEELIKIKTRFLKRFAEYYNIDNPDIDCLLRSGHVIISRNYKTEYAHIITDYGHSRDKVWKRGSWDITPDELYGRNGLNLKTFDSLKDRNDITFPIFQRRLELNEEVDDVKLTIKVDTSKTDITEVCRPAK